MDYKKILIHSPDSFKRARLLSRQKQLGFNNLARMELFLWDLEIYLQVQSLLKDKVVLKGGAAAQFYIPVEYQRTSVDIDLICLVSGAEIAEAVQNILLNEELRQDLINRGFMRAQNFSWEKIGERIEKVYERVY